MFKFNSAKEEKELLREIEKIIENQAQIVKYNLFLNDKEKKKISNGTILERLVNIFEAMSKENFYQILSKNTSSKLQSNWMEMNCLHNYIMLK